MSTIWSSVNRDESETFKKTFLKSMPLPLTQQGLSQAEMRRTINRPRLPQLTIGSQLFQFRAASKMTGGLLGNLVPHRMTLPRAKPRYPPPTIVPNLKLNLDDGSVLLIERASVRSLYCESTICESLKLIDKCS